MKGPSWQVFIAAVVLLLAFSFREAPGDRPAFIPGVKDSLLLVKNNIHKVRSVSETKVYRRNDWDVYYIGEGDTFLPPGPEIERVVTWTEYDRKGRKTYVIDSSTASDEYHPLKVTTRQYSYLEDKQVGLAEKEWYERMDDTGRTTRVERIENTTWTSGYTLHHTENEDAGQWNVQIDSTVYNKDGQPRITYSYNSMGDSFVEEFTYDAKARLKYRRLTMKQFWSPPWELESSSYSYNDDGSKVVIDSAWRNNPDMNTAVKRAGDRKATDYKWRVIACTPATGLFDRLETCVKYTYNSRDSLVHRQTWEQYASMWEDYTWVYDSGYKLILRTEYRGDPPGDHSVYGEACTDSIWYEYKNGMLYHEKVRRFCNTHHTDYDDTFHVDGVHVDPDRSFSFKYEDKESGIVEVITQYRHNNIDEITSFNEKGLLIRREAYSFYRDLTVTEYSYFTW